MYRTMTTGELKDSANGKDAALGGLVVAVKKTLDRKQNPMAFVTVEDKDGQAEAVMFSEVLGKHQGAVAEDNVLLLKGKVSRRNGGDGKLLVNAVLPLGEDRPPESKEVHISIDLENTSEAELDRMKKLLSRNRGSAKVFLHLREDGKENCVVRSKSLAVKLDYELLAELSGSVGADNIELVAGA
jgi:DNA polymerase-3 subunit alpha